MNRTEILKTAEKYVSADRNQQYGEPEDNFSLIAEYWSVYIGDAQIVLDAFDVAMMMSLMKFARLSKRPAGSDSAIDLAGYAACAGEILARERVRAQAPASSFHSDPSVPPQQDRPDPSPNYRRASQGKTYTCDDPSAKYTPADPKILKEPGDVF